MSDILNDKNSALVNGTVLIDKGALDKLSGSQLTEVIASLNGKAFRIVDNLAALKTAATARKLLADSDPLFVETLILRGVTLTDADMKKITTALSEIKALQAYLNGLITTDKYPFLEVPENYELPFKIGKDRISRNGYTIGHKTARRVFERAVAIWSEKEGAPRGGMHVSAGGYGRTAVFSPQRVSIGCQDFSRLDIEQLGLKMGWDFGG